MDIVKMIHNKANLYEKDGEPGPLGYNIPGWKTIATVLRDLADEIQNVLQQSNAADFVCQRCRNIDASKKEEKKKNDK